MKELTIDPIKVLLDAVDWVPVSEPQISDGLPTVTHEGTLNVGGMTLRVLQLSNGQRIFPAEEMVRLFGDIHTNPQPTP